MLISLDSATTVTKFDELLVEALGYDRSVAKKARYLDLLLRHGTRLLIIDDLHQLTATEKLGRQALDHLKAVVTALGEYGITVIFAGANLHTHPVMDDPQVTGRAYELTMNPYHADTDEAALAWQRFLKESGELLTLTCPPPAPGVCTTSSPGCCWPAPTAVCERPCTCSVRPPSTPSKTEPGPSPTNTSSPCGPRS